MATFREITYAVLDLLKQRSDDAYYTEEHVIFLAGKMRAILLERKYRNSRNGTFKPMSDENKQNICLSLIPASDISGACAGGWLMSDREIPSTIAGTSVSVYPLSDMLCENITFIPVERMPFVGHNKWLRNIIYCAKSADGRLYLHSVNPQFMYLEKVKVSGVFSDVETAAELSCDATGTECDFKDILDTQFPLEASLVPSCIELILQELTGSRYAPEDKNNNARDDMSTIAATTPNTKPVENTTYKPQEEQAE